MKTKKILFNLLTILCFGFSTFALAACGEQPTETPTEQPTEQQTNEPHVHVWEDFELTKEPTCTAAGEMTYTCSVCGENKVEDYSSPKGHKEVIDAAVDATCTETGLTEGKHCSTCNEVFVAQEVVAALNHNYVDYVCTECDYHYYTEGLRFNLNNEGYYTVAGYGGKDKDVVIPSVYNGKQVTTIGYDAFLYNGGITSITILEGVTSISDEAFMGCISLTSIVIPDSVTTIGGSAFCECRSLTSIVIPDSVTTIGRRAFYECSSLTSIVIPDSVISIGVGAFVTCRSLTSIMVDSNNNYYDSRNNCNAIIETSTNTLIAGCENTIIPNGVTSIGEAAFSGHSSLESIIIPDSVTSIGSGAFSGCSSLTSIVIPDSVTAIYDGTFSRCSSLTTVYYKGTKSQWNRLFIYIGDKELVNANIIYNYQG